MKILRLFLAILLAAGTASFTYGEASTISILNSDAPELPDSALPSEVLSDRSFLTLVARNNLEALAMTQAAQQRCQRPELQKLAQKFAREQRASLRKIREIAGDYAIDLTLADNRHLERLVVAFGALADNEFDFAYLEFMRVNQMAALQLLQAAAAETRLSADMRTLANNLIAVAWSHRHNIQMTINTIGIPRQEIGLRM